MTESLRPNLRRVAILDAVRGFCMIAVVVYHYKGPILDRFASPLLAKAFNPLWTCLDCFFVLSGFLLGGILLDNRGAKGLVPTFYARRALRILPLYFLAVLYNYYLHPDDDLLKYLTFTQNIVWAEHQSWGSPEIIVTWSLAVEEHFYLILPLLVWLVPAARLPFVLLLLIALAPLARTYCSLVADNQLAASILTPCRMDALFLGVLLAWLMRQERFATLVAANRSRLRGLALAAGLGFLAYAVWADPLGPFVKTIGLSLNGLFYAVFLLWLLMDYGAARLAFPLRFLSWVGLGAFAIYLSHVAVISAVRAHLGATPLAVVVTIAVIAALATLSWHLIEKPCIQLGRRIGYRVTVAPAMLAQAGVARP